METPFAIPTDGKSVGNANAQKTMVTAGHHRFEPDKGSSALPNPAELCYTVPAALLQSGNRKEVSALEYFANFLVSVGASVVAYYIRKWLDGHGKGK